MIQIIIYAYPIKTLNTTILHKITCDNYNVENNTLFARKITNGVRHTEKYEINEHMYISTRIIEES